MNEVLIVTVNGLPGGVFTDVEAAFRWLKSVYPETIGARALRDSRQSKKTNGVSLQTDGKNVYCFASAPFNPPPPPPRDGDGER